MECYVIGDLSVAYLMIYFVILIKGGMCTVIKKDKNKERENRKKQLLPIYADYYCHEAKTCSGILNRYNR